MAQESSIHKKLLLDLLDLLIEIHSRTNSIEIKLSRDGQYKLVDELWGHELDSLLKTLAEKYDAFVFGIKHKSTKFIYNEIIPFEFQDENVHKILRSHDYNGPESYDYYRIEIKNDLRQVRANIEAEHNYETGMDEFVNKPYGDYKFVLGYDEENGVTLNNHFRLAKPHKGKINEKIFKYLLENPNRAITKTELEKAIKEQITKPFSKFLDNVNIKRDLRKIFFEVHDEDEEPTIKMKGYRTHAQIERQLGYKLIRLDYGHGEKAKSKKKPKPKSSS